MEKPPRDVVPDSDAERARRDELDGQTVQVSELEVVEDADGIPAGVARTAPEPATFVIPHRHDEGVDDDD